jgi:hypothetical protein
MPKGNRPVYNVRAKLPRREGDERDTFITCGAAWPFDRGDGLTVKISALPVGFDGTLLLIPPRDE